MQQQAEIANLNRRILTTKMGDQVKRNALAAQDAFNVTSLQTSISSLMQQRMNKDSECTQAGNRMQLQAQSLQGNADVSGKEFRINYCQLQDLKDRCGMDVTSKNDSDEKALEDLNGLISGADKFDPCGVETTADGKAIYSLTDPTIPQYSGGDGCKDVCGGSQGGALILHDKTGKEIKK